MTDKPLPPWANEIPQGAFISYEPTYKVGEYFSNFHKGSFSLQTEQNSKALSYYFYDPTEHGYEKGKAYPLLVFMHGMSNALEGDVCINYAGAEFYSKSEYQRNKALYQDGFISRAEMEKSQTTYEQAEQAVKKAQ